MRIELRDTPFEPLAELARYQDGLATLRGRYGATACFIGTMRDFNEGEAVCGMYLEHYPGMTERELEKLVAEALERYGLLEALVIHRVGAIEPNQPIVLVAVWSAHRAAAFDGCRQIMEELKSRAPFWKRETLVETETSRWVARNTPG
ncbi:MAG TPA: molybdenum cofactor biosynthesis protein MoaE [Candidatus Competibacteraceae bacterium]|nr:molybdenum cofactor biosynthesis protein MoaE [Candidatus Competibacteraceae bacterium]